MPWLQPKCRRGGEIENERMMKMTKKSKEMEYVKRTAENWKEIHKEELVNQLENRKRDLEDIVRKLETRIEEIKDSEVAEEVEHYAYVSMNELENLMRGWNLNGIARVVGKFSVASAKVEVLERLEDEEQ